MEIRTTEFYARFYKKYNQYRDKLILAYLKRLRAKAKGPLTSQNINKVLDARDKYERVATAYWNARLSNRPFIQAKPFYANRENDNSRAAWLAYQKRKIDPNEYKGGYK